MQRECEVCGASFVVKHGSKKLCPECTDVIIKHRGRKQPYKYDGPKDAAAYEFKLRQRNIEAYCDTIVAEGYAERQRADTLSRVTKIKTSL